MNLPIEVTPPAKRYHPETPEPLGNRLRGLLIKLGASAKNSVQTTAHPETVKPPSLDRPTDPEAMIWNKGDHTLYVDDCRTIREIVSSPLVEEGIPIDLVPLLADLQRAITSVRHANNDHQLYDSLTNVRSLADLVAHKAETAGLSPAVSTSVRAAYDLLEQYGLAA